MIKSKGFFLSPNDIDNITDVIEHLSNVLKYGVRHDSMHNAWASYYRMAELAFRRMRAGIECSCDVEEEIKK